MNIKRLSINSWPFAAKFGLPCLLAFLLVIVIGVMANGVMNNLQTNLQDVVEKKFNASFMLAGSVEQLRAANGSLHEMQINQAAGLKQDIDGQSKRISADLDKITATLTGFQSNYASPAEAKKIDNAIANIKRYKDATAFVASMLDVDFKATVNFLTPLAESYDGMIADLDGITAAFLEQSKAQAQAAVADAASRRMSLFIVASIILAITALITGAVVVATVRSIQRVAHTTRLLADGDSNVDVGGLTRSDELGQIVDALAVFRENIERVRALEEEQKERERQSVAERKKALTTMADEFEASVGQIVSAVASASTQLHSNAENLSSLADHTNRESGEVASASEEANASVQTVASATEELSASINEITRQVTESTRITAVAVDQITRTDVTVSSLSEAAAEIGDVVNLIRNIAHQTNLLALNATIEAARAGDAGKGFAVVASEVKNLANQTAKATEGITLKIDTIQAVSAEAVTAIREIGRTVSQTNEIAGTIASAITEQAAATGEISRNVQQTSNSTGVVSESIVSVTQAAYKSQGAATQVLSASKELSDQAETLRLKIGDFLSKVRAG